ncbi:hypothetical protein BH18ACT4_BH18ACT4_00920 [soil metagenome]
MIFRRRSARPLPLARCSTEAHLYMDLRPCGCGEVLFPRDSSVVQAGGDLASRYSGSCISCGTYREFVFRLPMKIDLPQPGVVRFGDGEASELLDPGEWLWIADRYAAAYPADISPMNAGERRQAHQAVATAAAAMDEVLAFVPPGRRAVPGHAFRSERGRAVHAIEPGRFALDRLQVVRDTYRQILIEQRITMKEGRR